MSADATIERARRRIDALDCRLVKLLSERARAAITIGRTKRKKGDPVFAPDREERVLVKVAGLAEAEGVLSGHAMRCIYSEIISACRSAERQVTVVFLGPRGTFSHQAARQAAEACLARHAARIRFGSSVEFQPVNGIDAVFAEVAQGRADYGVTPIENSTEGGIGATLDMFMESDLKVCAEVLVHVHHAFMTKSRPDEVARIYSKAEVFGQCKGWLANHFPEAQLIEASSTARGAELAARTRGAAAIAHEETAYLHGLTVLHRAIEDNPFNITRFYVIAREDVPPTGHDKTSILCFIRDEPGALHRILLPFWRAKVNLTKIESWPSKRKAWDYCFFIDLKGHRKSPAVARALEKARAHCSDMKILGSFPTAESRARG